MVDAPALAVRAGTVLLVEDDPVLAEVLQLALSQAGYSVDHAPNGSRALSRLRQFVPDVVVSDVQMPEMDGLTLLRELRADGKLRLVPVLLLTSQSAVSDVVAGLELGADDYIAKPVNLTELVARVRSKIERPSLPADAVSHDRRTGFLKEAAFRRELDAELARAQRVGYPCTLVRIRLYELERLRELWGARLEATLIPAVAQTLAEASGRLDIIGRAGDGSFLILMPEATVEEVETRLAAISRAIVRSSYPGPGETLRVTPISGFVDSARADTPDLMMERAQIALAHAAAHLDLRPIRFEAAMLAGAKAGRGALLKWFASKAERFRLGWQIYLTYVIGWLIPFCVYAALGSNGLDITGAIYILLVATLLITAILIWIEGILALKRADPPELPPESYPPMSAIIAAYLPNEAATLESTIRAFLCVDYPADLQIILAYNTPFDMPIEERLHEMAREDPRFLPLRVQGSTSKAQNVNAALSLVRSPAVGVFDADHQPDPDSFQRAWRWIADGWDIVQGHCFIRNGDVSWAARTVAVEFELIYTVSHPGRARLHAFGIFGGSNGFWRTEILRETRFRGSMLTEDIDSALRAVEAGYKIASDPYLVSRELSPTTLQA